MARYITGESREQLDLLPPSLDDLIPDEHLVRVIDLYVDSLDLDALGFERARPAATGRPGYIPPICFASTCTAISSRSARHAGWSVNASATSS